MKNKMIRMMKKMYKSTLNEGITDEGIIGKFVTERKVRQGCSMSTILFDLYVNDIDEEWERWNEESSVIGNTKIFCLKFVDDIAAEGDNKEGFQNLIKELRKYSEKNGLEINAGKAKIMLLFI